MSPETEAVLEKVKKLLALANNSGATENERENAMRMAQKFLAKHNLSMAQAESFGINRENRVFGRLRFYGRPWAQVICASIAKMCFCSYVVTPAEKAKDTMHYFVGKESNATTAAHLSRFIVESVLKESKKFQRSLGLGNKVGRSFALGAAGQVAVRVDQIIAASAHESTPSRTGKEIVLASIYDREKEANDKLVKESFTATRAGNVDMENTDGLAFANGAAYGDTIPLNRQIGEAHGQEETSEEAR